MAHCAAASSVAGFAPLAAARRREVGWQRRGGHCAAAARRRVAVRASASEAPAAAEAGVDNEEDDEDEYVESAEVAWERQAVGRLVGWCVERGASGSGLSVLLPDGTGRGRGLEASRAIEVRALLNLRDYFYLLTGSGWRR